MTIPAAAMLLFALRQKDLNVSDVEISECWCMMSEAELYSCNILKHILHPTYEYVHLNIKALPRAAYCIMNTKDVSDSMK